MPAVVEHEDAAPVARLFELPLPRRPGDFPAAVAGRDHFEVQPGGFADLARLDDFLQAAERLVVDEVLHHAQVHAGGVGGRDHLVRFFERVRERLLQIHVEAGAQRLAGDLAVQRRRHQDVDRVEIGGEHRVEIGELLRVRPFGTAFREAGRVGIAQRDDLDVVVVAVAARDEVVDAAEADDTDAGRSSEGQRHVRVRSSCSSMVLPAGSVIQICTTAPCAPRLYSTPWASSSATAASMSSTPTQ